MVELDQSTTSVPVYLISFQGPLLLSSHLTHLADIVPRSISEFVRSLRGSMASLQPSTIRLCLEWSQQRHRGSMYLRDASLDIPRDRQHPQSNARIIRYKFGGNVVFLYILVSVYPAINNVNPTMAYPHQDQVGRLLFILYWHVGALVGSCRWSRGYIDEKGGGPR